MEPTKFYQPKITTLVLLLVLLLVIVLSIYLSSFSRKKNNESQKKVVEYEFENTEIIKLCNKFTENCCSLRYPCCVSNAIEMVDYLFFLFKKYSIPIWLSGITLEDYIKCGGFYHSTDKIQLETIVFHQCYDNLMKELSNKYVVRTEIGEILIQYSENNSLKLHLKISEKCLLKKETFYGIEIYVPLNTNISFCEGKSYPLKLYTNNQSENKDLNIYRCYIINSKHRKDRLNHVISECDKHNLSATTISATEGENLNLQELIDNNFLQITNDYHMSKNTIACYLSHVKAIETISKLQTDMPCLVLEDDIVFLKDFHNILKQIKYDVEQIDWDIIILGGSLANDQDEFIPTNSPYLFRSGLVLGTWAYLLTPKSAKKILKDIYPVIYPIDLTITVQDPNFDSKYIHDTRYLNKITKLVVHTGNYHKNNRFGIIDELSTFEWRQSTSG